jgi:hypothetical protein
MASCLPERLAADGIVYGLVPPRWRSKVRRLLRDQGLALEDPILHLPNRAASRHLVPLDGTAALYAFSKLLPNPPWKRRLALAGLSVPRLLWLFADLWPSVGFAARRPGSRPVFDWLFRYGGDAQGQRSAMMSANWRGPSGSVIVLRFSEGEPVLVAKLSWQADMALNESDEPAIIARLGPDARRAGAQLPQCLLPDHVGGHPVLFQRAIRGESAAALLAAQPGRLFEVMERVTGWLVSWNSATQARRSKDDVLQEQILAPAAQVAPLLVQGGTYYDWLVARCTAITGWTPVVAAHNDLTMWNILYDEAEQLGIVDWNEAREDVLPLGDFFYAMTDAVVMAGSGSDRLQAFEACFAPWGKHRQAVAALLLRLKQALSLSDDLIDLCLHACFLRHALNEQRQRESAASGEAQPFLQIVRWLAFNRLALQASLAQGIGRA